MTGDIEVRVTSPGNAPPSSTSYAIIAEYLHAADLLGLSYTIIRDGTNMTSRGAPTERWTLQLHVADDPRRVQPALKGEGEGSP